MVGLLPAILEWPLVMFIAPDWKDAEAIHLYTDASGTLGFGAFFNGTWIRGDWQPHQQLPKCSIPWQELFTILAAALTWGYLLSGQFHYDSPPIVQAWANQSLKHPETYGTFEDTLFHSCTAQLHRVPGAPPMMAERHRRCPVT